MEQLDLGDDGMTVAELLDRYELVRMPEWSPSTVLGYGVHSKPVFDAYGDRLVSDLTSGDIEDVNAGWAAAGLKATTIGRRNSIPSAALNWAERKEIIAKSPTRNVDLPSIEKRHVEVADMAPAFASIRRLKHDRLRVVAWLAVATGMRRGELLALRWLDVDLDNGALRITRSLARGPERTLVVKGTKSGQAKVRAIDPETVEILKVWKRTVTTESHAAGAGRPDVASLVFRRRRTRWPRGTRSTSPGGGSTTGTPSGSRACGSTTSATSTRRRSSAPASARPPPPPGSATPPRRCSTLTAPPRRRRTGPPPTSWPRRPTPRARRRSGAR